MEQANEQATPRAELVIGSSVVCRDGEAGRLEHVVINPRRGQVTHLVVHHGLLRHTDRIVPVEAIQQLADHEVTLGITLAELDQCPLYDARAYSVPSQVWQALHGYGPDEALIALGVEQPVQQSHSAERSGVLPALQGHDPLPVTVISEGMEVFCADGKVGRVALVLLDPQTHYASHIVVRRGWLTTRDIIVPLDWIIEVEPGSMLLDVQSWQLEQLPEYRPDEEIAEDVRQVLYDDPAFHGRADFYTLHVEVLNGVVTLQGNVRDRLLGLAAERLARGVRGVAGVHNQLQPDDMIAQAVHAALTQDDRLQIHDLKVRVLLGLVHLDGVVPDDDQRQLAGEIARRLPGVQAVNNRLSCHDVSWALEQAIGAMETPTS